MKISVLQQVDFEGPGVIADWAEARGADLEIVHAYKGDSISRAAGADLLVVLGGPMGVYDDQKFPWLRKERELLEAAIAEERAVLGICLGAQLVASVLGAEVTHSPYKEIGWFPVRTTAAAGRRFMHDVLPKEFTAFHWHGDMFAIPEGAVTFAETDACPNQGFLYRDRVLALQFHLEVNLEGAKALMQACPQDLDSGRFAQSSEQISESSELFTGSHGLMFAVLDALCSQ